MLTMAEAVREAMSIAFDERPEVFLLGEDVGIYGGAFGVSGDMYHRYGSERVLDTPIAELGIVGAAVGAALSGMRPIVEIQFSDFTAQAMDQIANQAAKIHFMLGGALHVPMVLRTPQGSGTGAAAQHSQNLEPWFASVPGLKVVVPSNPADAKGLLKSAIRDNDPVIFMESEQMYGDKGMVPDGEYLMPIGVADIKKAGTDVTIVSFGKMMKIALKAAEELAAENINAEVIDLRTVRPIDYATVINSVKKTNRLVIVEESWPLAAIATEVAFKVQREAFDYLDAPVLRVMGGDVPLPYAPTLIEAYLPNPARVIKAVKEVMYMQKA
ncbi:MAG: alpha-ketoacid dehydrogenase subunit beta [Actinobacteria bacterium]|nr:alpha-ketoacid dehydrogenase subunit beta [Actinomycetota bacterium]